MQNFADMKANRGGPPRTDSKPGTNAGRMKQRAITKRKPTKSTIEAIRRTSNEYGLDYMLFGAFSPMRQRPLSLPYAAKRGTD